MAPSPSIPPRSSSTNSPWSAPAAAASKPPFPFSATPSSASRNCMNVPLTPELEQLVESKVKSGRYRSASEVIREALRLLEMRDEVFTLHKDEIRTQIEEGWQAAKRGEWADGDDVFDRMDAELEAMQRSAPK